MNRDELDQQISDAVTNAIKNKLTLLDIVAVLESSKMAIQIIMHESTKIAGLLPELDSRQILRKPERNDKIA